MNDTTSMTPDHPGWEEFTSRLGGPEGCDWSEDGWRCHHDHHFTRAILGSMRGVDVDASIAALAALGGHCDCEILLNVDTDPVPGPGHVA